MAYYLGDYETASNKLYGLKLSKSDELIFKKASLLYRLDLFMEKADAYGLTGNEKKYLDSFPEMKGKYSFYLCKSADGIGVNL